ncbi:MAG: hypothetical protein Q8P83_03610 [bacterium]|nr:hypothetical protein [bacterium]
MVQQDADSRFEEELEFQRDEELRDRATELEAHSQTEWWKDVLAAILITPEGQKAFDKAFGSCGRWNVLIRVIKPGRRFPLSWWPGAEDILALTQAFRLADGRMTGYPEEKQWAQELVRDWTEAVHKVVGSRKIDNRDRAAWLNLLEALEGSAKKEDVAK